MGGVEPLHIAEGAGPGGFIGAFVCVPALLLRGFIKDWFNSHVHGGEVD